MMTDEETIGDTIANGKHATNGSVNSAQKVEHLNAFPDGKWKNLWREICEEEIGVEEMEKQIAAEFQVPEPGWLSGFWLQVQILKLKFGISMRARGKSGGVRISHPTGVGGVGTARVLDDVDIPENDFFTPGRTFTCRVRHGSTRPTDDEAGLQARSCSIKFEDTREGGPLDFLMNTGSMAGFYNLPSFEDITRNINPRLSEEEKRLVMTNPFYKMSTIEASRRNPESFTQMLYYSQITFILKTKDGKDRLVRFKMTPEDMLSRECESGLLDVHDQRYCWHLTRLEGDTRSKTYLSDQYKEEVKQRPLKYFLEIQVHDEPHTENTDPNLFNIAKDWDQEKAPWRRLAEIVITKTLEDYETQVTRFSPNNRPECMVIPEPDSIYDFRSIPYIRTKMYAVAQNARTGNAVKPEGCECPKE